MKINLISYRLLLLLITLSTFFSCVKEDFDPEKLDTEIIINPGVAAPLGFAHYELGDLMNEAFLPEEIMIDDNGFISMVYEEEILSYNASELMQLSVSPISGSIDNNSPFQIDLYATDTLKQSDTLYFDLMGSDGPDYTEIDSIKLDSLTIFFSLSSNYHLDGRLYIHSPAITRDNKYWKTHFPLSSDFEQSFKLYNYTINLSNDPSDVNTIPIIFTNTLIGSEGIVNPGSSILNYTLGINDIDYSVIYGYLGITNIQIDPQRVSISFYDPIIDGTFHFEEPELKLYFENSFGLPIRVTMTDFYATSRQGYQIDITGDSVPSETYTRIIRYPSLYEAGQTAYDSLILNPGNTNLFNVFESSPSSITFGANAETNPSGNTENKNFITDQSHYGVKAKLILPLYGYANFMLMMDTLKFDFEDFFQNPPEEIKKLAFRMNFTNCFPVNVYMQIYFTDENYTVIDSVFNDRHLIEAGMDTDGDGKIDPYQNDPIEVEFSRTKIDNISEARYIFLNGRINTTNYDLTPPEIVKFYTHYFIDGYIGVVGDVELNSTGN